MDDFFDLAPCRRADLDATDAAIRRALRSGELVTPRRGVVVGALRALGATTARERHALDVQVAIAATPGPPTYACLGSAGVLHGFDRLGRTPQRVRLYRDQGSRWRDEAVAVLVCGLPPQHLVRVDGIPATSPARTVVDLARWVTFRSGVVVADSALRTGVTRHEVERVARECRRWPVVRKARAATAFADRRAATPLESISRVAFHEMGLPAPDLQVPLVWDDFGNPTTIVDFYWEEFRVVGEADGLLKYDGDGDEQRDALRREKLRQEELEDLNFIVVRWTWEQIWRRPEWVAMRLRRAMARRGLRSA
jgi:hypothetical protein